VEFTAEVRFSSPVLFLLGSRSFSVAGHVLLSQDEWMNTPTHIACGACLAHVVAHATAGQRQTAKKLALVTAGVLALGVLSHLALDLLPHYAWIVYLDWFDALPYHWLIREAAFGFAVAVVALCLSGRAWPFVILGMVAGMYPDIEKVLCIDHGLPRVLVLFDWHSGYLSTRTGGLPKPLLIAGECTMIGAFLFVMWKLKLGASNKRNAAYG
jgi:hypothetical protein